MATGRRTRGLGRVAALRSQVMRESGCGVMALVMIVSTTPANVEDLGRHATVKQRLPT
jgi:hypothetical protein